MVSKKSQFNALSPSEDEERTIESDKKLNVSITRAKEQFFLIGDRRLLFRLPSYKAFIDEIEVDYSAHSPKEPLAKYAATRKTEEMAEAAPQGQVASQGSEPSVAQRQSENFNPATQSGGKKKTLWSRFLNFMEIEDV